MAAADVVRKCREALLELSGCTVEDRVAALNAVKLAMHEVSPMQSEPVDCVLWVDSSAVVANDYNPNKVAPPEMKLLAKSIEADGYTQPIVAFAEDAAGPYEVVDGFHRHRVGKEVKSVRSRVRGYLPVVLVRPGRGQRGDRMSSTIRHNRARGKHTVEGMMEIVAELSKRNWSDARIGRELGMEPDEVLRLKQITGLADLFSDREFSEAWEPVEPSGT